MQHRLVFYPDYQLTNPYQSLVYAHLHDTMFAEAGTIERAIQHLEGRPRGRTIFHLHWQEAVYAAAEDATSAEKAAQQFLCRVQAFIDAGGLFVWTLHNARPHRQRYAELDLQFRRAVAEAAHLVQVHSFAAVEVARSLGAVPRRLTVVPHGNYLPMLRRAVLPREERRALLGAKAGERLLVHFGRLLPYKGTATLLEALSGLTASPGWRLLIAGVYAETFDLAAMPPELASRVVKKAGHMEHQDLADLVDAADLVVLPYDEVLTSGATLLALSLGKPVVLPGLDTLREIVSEGRDGWFYAPEAGAAGLADAIERALSIDHRTLQDSADAALRTAMRYDWLIIGGQFSDALLRVIMDANRVPRPLPILDPL